jgi:hypothetical protein
MGNNLKTIIAKLDERLEEVTVYLQPATDATVPEGARAASPPVIAKGR